MGLYAVARFVWQHPLNADGRWAAMRRLARWQVISRLTRGPIALPFVEGTHLLTTRGMTGATGNWYCGLHEPREMAFVLHLLRPGDHFLDVGANIGSYTVLAAGAVGARVTSVEPIPSTFEHLERNIASNGLSGLVTPCPVGVSDVPGALRFTNTLDTVNHVLADGEDAPSIDVAVSTVDRIVNGDVPVLMKIDVEGHEARVLRGAAQTLADPRLLAAIVETNGSGARYGASDDAISLLLEAHGFRAQRYDPFTRTLGEASRTDGNTIFVRDRAAVESRLQGAKRYRLINGTI